jgi:hypothetical protein
MFLEIAIRHLRKVKSMFHVRAWEEALYAYLEEAGVSPYLFSEAVDVLREMVAENLLPIDNLDSLTTLLESDPATAIAIFDEVKEYLVSLEEPTDLGKEDIPDQLDKDLLQADPAFKEYLEEGESYKLPIDYR